MDSWVRYSIAVYLGLLLAGATLGPMPQRSIGHEPPRLEPIRAASPAPAKAPAMAAPAVRLPQNSPIRQACPVAPGPARITISAAPIPTS